MRWIACIIEAFSPPGALLFDSAISPMDAFLLGARAVFPLASASGNVSF